MITHYRCPDGKIIKCKDCIKSCRMSTRCVPPSVPAYVFNHQRDWKGKMSVTQALNPSTQNYLKITQNNIVELERHIYSMIGTVNHAKHEEGGLQTPGIESEIPLEDDLNYGTTDMLEKKDGKYYLRDIKNKKCAQMYFLLDYKRIGNKDFALHSSLQSGSKLKDTDDVVLQMNRYRMMLEKERKIKIEKMYMDIVLIDFSPTTSPKKYGLNWQSYSVPVKFLKDDYVLNFYKKAHEELTKILKGNGPEKFCYELDNWKEFGKEGSYNRCRYYCECSDACVRYFKKKGKKHAFFGFK